MYILKSLSAAFSRFWRWIRETAWVQPLLIVGGIFAVIFSIPKFTTWFQAMSAEGSSGYLSSFRLSLEGEGRVDIIDGKEKVAESAADALTRTLAENSCQFVQKDDFASYEAFHANLEETGALKYGEKYFLAYVTRESSTGSENAKTGFETLEKNWNTRFSPTDATEEFKLHTIFTDDTSTNDDDYTLDNDKKAVSRYLNKWNGGNGGADFFSFVGTDLETTWYKTNANIADSNYEHITMPDVDTFGIPTIFLIDFTETAFDAGRFGIVEAVFSVSGDTDYDKARLLMNMWNHNDSDTDNPFSKDYISK